MASIGLLLVDMLFDRPVVDVGESADGLPVVVDRPIAHLKNTHDSPPPVMICQLR
jgi:hypothetical protein